jgi:hypothetical protein
MRMNNLYLTAFSSIPPEYVGNRLMQHHSSGDVVIVVPGVDNEQIGHSFAGHICIDTEQEIEQNSPKTITESSSKYPHPDFV